MHIYYFLFIFLLCDLFWIFSSLGSWHSPNFHNYPTDQPCLRRKWSRRSFLCLIECFDRHLYNLISNRAISASILYHGAIMALKKTKSLSLVCLWEWLGCGSGDSVRRWWLLRHFAFRLGLGYWVQLDLCLWCTFILLALRACWSVQLDLHLCCWNQWIEWRGTRVWTWQSASAMSRFRSAWTSCYSAAYATKWPAKVAQDYYPGLSSMESWCGY